MSTGVVIIQLDGAYRRVHYASPHAHPDGAGRTVKNYLSNHCDEYNLSRLKENVRSLREPSSSGFVSDSAGSAAMMRDIYSDGRPGGPIYAVVNNSWGRLYQQLDWAYVVNLDVGTYEVYADSGTPLTLGDRFFEYGSNGGSNRLRLVCAIPFDELSGIDLNIYVVERMDSCLQD